MVGTACADTVLVNATYNKGFGNTTNLIFANQRAGIGDDSPAGTTGVGTDIGTIASANTYDYTYYDGITFPTSDLPDDCTITSATIYGYSGANTHGLGDPNMTFVDFNPYAVNFTKAD